MHKHQRKPAVPLRKYMRKAGKKSVAHSNRIKIELICFLLKFLSLCCTDVCIGVPISHLFGSFVP